MRGALKEARFPSKIEHGNLEFTGANAACVLKVKNRFLERVRRGMLIGSDPFIHIDPQIPDNKCYGLPQFHQNQENF